MGVGPQPRRAEPAGVVGCGYGHRTAAMNCAAVLCGGGLARRAPCCHLCTCCKDGRTRLSWVSDATRGGWTTPHGLPLPALSSTAVLRGTGAIVVCCFARGSSDVEGQIDYSTWHKCRRGRQKTGCSKFRSPDSIPLEMMIHGGAQRPGQHPMPPPLPGCATRSKRVLAAAS